jgi:hypothetical protein
MNRRMICTVRATRQALATMIWDVNRTIGAVLRFLSVLEPRVAQALLSVEEDSYCHYGEEVGSRLPLDRREYRLSAMLGELVFGCKRQRGS